MINKNLLAFGIVVVRLLYSLASECQSKTAFQDKFDVDVFWMNLESSVNRRNYMEEQLRFYGMPEMHRVSAATPRDIVLPLHVGLPADCMSVKEGNVKNILASPSVQGQISAVNPSYTPISVSPSKYKTASKPEEAPIEAGSEADAEPLDNESRPRRNRHTPSGSNSTVAPYVAFITDHCGRKKNTKRELTVTVTHLKTLHAAVSYVPPAPAVRKKFALILEDDVRLPFEIDFNKLIEAAPADFAMIQFVTTNEKDLLDNWRRYSRTGDLWTLRVEQDLWCASAYLINKDKVAPVLSKLLIDMGQGVMRHRIIAGYTRPCTPTRCCTSGEEFEPKGPCVHAPRGYQADHFIFSLVPGHTYLSNVPLVTGGRVGNRSTVHQEHVASHHVNSFNRINSYLNEMKTKVTLPPPFLSTTCSFQD